MSRTFCRALQFAALGLLLAACAPLYLDPYPVEAVVLPRDEAAHPAPIEWWYYTGHFSDDEGRDYGFELTFFKAYTPPGLKLFGALPASLLADRGHVAHFAISDLSEERFEMAERTDFWGYPAEASRERFDVQVANWYARAVGDAYELYAELPGKRLKLTLTPSKPAALHGDPPGIQSMGPGGVSYYLSYTRMRAEGTLSACSAFSCDVRPVTGQAWHDHQWGDFSVTGYAGWDWFSLQFDTNTELMLYLIRAPSGTYIAGGGSYVFQDGRTLELPAEAFEVTATGDTWRSAVTGAVYPVAWRVRVPAYGIDTEVRAALLDQEMNTRASTGLVYWEGAVVAEGSPGGVGYVELTNYDLYPYGETDEDTPLKPLPGPFGSR